MAALRARPRHTSHQQHTNQRDTALPGTVTMSAQHNPADFNRSDNREFSGDYVEYYQRQMYGSSHMQDYLKRRCETLRRVVQQAGGDSRRLRVLEVACGPGLSLSYLRHLSKGHQFVGMDASVEMLSLARKNNSGADGAPQLARGSAFQLPFADATFDVVYSTRFLHMFRDKSPIVKELCRVVKPSGLIAVEFYHRPYNMLRWVMERRPVPMTEWGYHFPSFNEVRGLMGAKAEIVPLRLGGERLVRSLVNESVVRRLLGMAWTPALRWSVDEYFAIARRA
jgi:ubiquinone/menaquinone biosynthesis C-methylase UbiE